MQKSRPKRKIHPAEKQSPPGFEFKMKAQPPRFAPDPGSAGKKLREQVVLITGADSGIGRAVAVLFALHGAHIALCYLPEEEKDAQITRDHIAQYNQQCLLIPGDLTREKNCIAAVKKTVRKFGRLDVLINNAALHYPQKSLGDISTAQLHETFDTNVYPMFYMTREALKHLPEGGSIINTASVTAYRGSSHLIDYSATKGAIVSFTRSLSASLAQKKIRVNAVAPGPVWTPLIVSSMDAKAIKTFGSDCPMGRAAHPAEIAPCYLFLASSDAVFMTGQVLHPNGGEVVNG